MRYFRGKWRTFAEICLHNSEQHFSDFSSPNLYCYLSWASMGRMTAIMSRVRVNANCDIPLAKGTNLWGWLEVLALWHIWTPPTKTRDRTQAESTTWKEVVNKSQKLALFLHTVPKILFSSKNTFLVFFQVNPDFNSKKPKKKTHLFRVTYFYTNSVKIYFMDRNWTFNKVCIFFFLLDWQKKKKKSSTQQKKAHNHIKNFLLWQSSSLAFGKAAATKVFGASKVHWWLILCFWDIV